MITKKKRKYPEIIHGRDVFHVLLRRRHYAHRAPPYDAYTHILLRLSLILCLTWLKTKKKDVRCFLCPLEKSTTNTCRSSLYTSTTIPFVIIRLFTFFVLFVCFFQFARRRCVAYLPSFISDSTSSRPEKNITLICWWRLHLQPLAGGEKRKTASSPFHYSASSPKANPIKSHPSNLVIV